MSGRAYMASRSADSNDGRLQLEYGIQRDETATEAVVRAVMTASASGIDEIPPLFDSIDPDSLNTICESLSDEYRIEFVHHGFFVTITGDDTVYLHPTEDRAAE